MAKEKILVVDDEEDIAELVRYNLEKEGFQVVTASSGEEALEKVRELVPNLVVLDLMLPGIDGLEVCRSIKRDSRTQQISVLMLTAKGEDSDIVTGLEVGADDYVPKPFSPKVLIARVKNALRKKRDGGIGEEDKVVRDELVIIPDRREVLIKDKGVELTNTEFKLLHLLAKHPGKVYSREQIVDLVHGEDYPVTDRSVDVQVVGLRKKLGRLGKSIETVRGVGYRFKG